MSDVTAPPCMKCEHPQGAHCWHEKPESATCRITSCYCMAYEPPQVWTMADEQRWQADARCRDMWQRQHRKAIEQLVGEFGCGETVSYLIVERLVQRAGLFRAALAPFDRQEEEEQ